MGKRKWKSRKKKKGAGAGKVLLALFLAALAAADAGAWLIWAPYGPASETFVEIATGSPALQIGRQLEEAGVVRSQFAFDLLRWCRRGRLQAGEYRFDHPASASEVYDRIARGDTFTIALTVPEGANLFDIAERAEQAGLGSRQEFVEAARTDTSLVADLDPEAKSLEGYLFPDTYRFNRRAAAAQMVAAMVKRFRAAAAQLGLKVDVREVVTMASLVERETAVSSERPVVASVYENRLKRKMPLMADPSVIYGLELDGMWRGAIYQSDLKRSTPYNTYLNVGLPPGPIANPGLSSLSAAMQPAHTDYLYFVAAGDNPQGRSLFSATLDEHQRDVAGYRRALRKAGAR